MDLSHYEELHKQLTPEQCRQYAKAAIWAQFGLGDIEGNNDARYQVNKGIGVLYALAGEEAFSIEAKAANLLALPSDRPVPGFARKAHKLIGELRDDRPFRDWPRELAAVRRTLLKCTA